MLVARSRLRHLTRAIALLVAALVLPASAASAAGSSLWRSLAQAAPAANPQVLRLAVAAMRCAVASGMPGSQRLAVIDYHCLPRADVCGFSTWPISTC